MFKFLFSKYLRDIKYRLTVVEHEANRALSFNHTLANKIKALEKYLNVEKTWSNCSCGSTDHYYHCKKLPEPKKTPPPCYLEEMSGYAHRIDENFKNTNKKK